MNLLTLINHFYAIIYGLISSGLFLSFLYLTGVVLFPRGMYEQRNGSTLPFFYGTAIFCLICWYAIQFSISLFTLFPYLLFGVMVTGLGRLFIFKTRLFSTNLYSQQSKFRWGAWALPYSIFYILAYLSLLPSFSPEANLLRWIGNNDILNYINITHYFSHLGPSNVVGHSYIEHASYAATPGVFYCFSLFSLLYNGDALSAAMPLLFTCMALIGLTIYRYCQEIFALTQTIAVSLAALIIFGGFYHYIQGNYFLSTLMVTSSLIYLLTETIKLDYLNSSQKALFSVTLPCLMLIFFLYPVILFCSFVIQWGLIGLKILFSWKKYSFKTLFQHFLKSTVTLFVCLGLVFLSNPSNFMSFLRTLVDFANMTGGGWGLSLISPFAVLGIPSPLTLSSSVAQFFTLLGFSILVIFCAVEGLKLKKTNAINTSAIVFFIFSVMAIFIYILYYYHLGPSRYQPWKFASYYALPFCGGILAMFSRILQSKNNFYPWKKITVVLVTLALVGNIFIIWKGTPPFQTLSNKYRRLGALDQMGFSTYWIKMSDYSSTFLPVYFIPHKTLRLLSDSYYPMQSLEINQITPSQPLFVETTKKCVGTSSNQVINILNVGCLYLNMPTLPLNEILKQNQEYVFIQTKGFNNPESWGRWSSKKQSSITLLTRSRLLVHHSSGVIKLKVYPFIHPGIKGQHLKILWGKNSSMTLFIKDEQWISLPYSKNDWHKNTANKSISQLTLSLSFPDAIPANRLDPKSSNTESLGIGLVAIKLN